MPIRYTKSGPKPSRTLCRRAKIKHDTSPMWPPGHRGQVACRILRLCELDAFDPVNAKLASLSDAKSRIKSKIHQRNRQELRGSFRKQNSRHNEPIM